MKDIQRCIFSFDFYSLHVHGINLISILKVEKSTLFCVFFLSIQSLQQITFSLLESDSVVEIDATVKVESNATTPFPRSKEDSFANMIDRALEKEFNETDQNEGLR